MESNEWLRKNVLVSVERSEQLLDALRFNWELTPIERKAVWLLLWEIVWSAANRHYKQRQKIGLRLNRRREWYDIPTPSHGKIAQYRYDVNLERVLLLLEFLKANKHKSAAWCVATYKIRFPLFEQMIQLRLSGVYVPIHAVQHREVRDAMMFTKLCRQAGVKPNEYGAWNHVLPLWEKHQVAAQRPVTEQRVSNLYKRWLRFLSLLMPTKYAHSIDATELLCC
jgi:hypothetical protein